MTVLYEGKLRILYWLRISFKGDGNYSNTAAKPLSIIKPNVPCKFKDI